MKRKRIRVIGISIILFMIITFIPSLINAAPITVEYKDNNGIKSVDILELANAMKSNVNEVDGRFTVILNSKNISFEEGGNFITIDGQVIALRYEEKETEDTKEVYKLPMPQKIEKINNSYLFPIEFIEKYIGIKGEESGFIFEDEVSKDEVSKDNNSTNGIINNESSNQSINNKKPSNQSGNVNNSNNNNNSSSTDNNSNNNSNADENNSSEDKNNQDEENTDENSTLKPDSGEDDLIDEPSTDVIPEDEVNKEENEDKIIENNKDK